MSEFQQFTTWRVCQVCTAHVSADAAGDDWLVSPLRANPDILVVRCPLHWSEWALRCCEAGRTNGMRDRARKARASAEAAKAARLLALPRHLAAFPIADQDALD